MNNIDNVNVIYNFLEVVAMGSQHGLRSCVEVVAPAKSGKTEAIVQLCDTYPDTILRIKENTTAYQTLHNIAENSKTVKLIIFDDFSWLSPNYVDDFISRVKQVCAGSISYQNFKQSCTIPETKLNASVIVLNNEQSHAKAFNKMIESGLHSRLLQFRYRVESSCFNTLYKQFYKASLAGKKCKLPFKKPSMQTDLKPLAEDTQEHLLNKYSWTDVTNIFNLKTACDTYGYNFSSFEPYFYREVENPEVQKMKLVLEG
jgi:hypothetical protein